MSYVNYFDGQRISDGWAAHRARGSLGGIDYAVGVGTPIKAPTNGRVQNIPYNGTGGHTVTFWHGDGGLGSGFRDQFMHLSSFVGEGNYSQGDIIGYTGGAKGSDGSGSSDGPHVHWHLINPSGSRVNPLEYVGGGSGSSVAEYQALLNQFGYNLAVDGDHGPKTDAAVRDFQAKNGLVVDGIVGPITMAALKRGPASGLVVDGDFGPATKKALQSALGVTVDGDFGPASTRALQDFLGVPADGDWGPQTTRALQGFLGVAVDGDFGPASTRALQERLNAGTFIKPAPAPAPEPTPTPAPVVEESVVVVVEPSTPVEPTPEPEIITPTPEEKEDIVVVTPVTKEEYADITSKTDSIAKDAEDDLSQYDLASIGFWNYAGERVIKTFAMTFASLLSTTGAIVITAPESANIFAQIGWVYIASVSGVSALTSLLVALSSFKNIVTLKKKK